MGGICLVSMIQCIEAPLYHRTLAYKWNNRNPLTIKADNRTQDTPETPICQASLPDSGETRAACNASEGCSNRPFACNSR